MRMNCQGSNVVRSRRSHVDKKHTRGLPSSFGLDVARSAIQGPVQLGDYLEEEDLTPVKPAAKPASDYGVDMSQARAAEAVPPSMTPPPVRPRPPRLPVAKPAKLSTTVPRKQE